MNKRLNLVKVLTRLFLEAVLSVQNKLERLNRTDGVSARNRAIFDPSLGGATGTGSPEHRGAGTFDGGNNDVRGRSRVGREHDIRGRSVGGKVPTGRRARVRAENQTFDRVIVAKPDLLRRARLDGISAGMLHLFDKVLMALLRKASAFFRVEIHVVGPDLERRTIGVVAPLISQVKIEAYFMVLQRDKRES